LYFHAKLINKAGCASDRTALLEVREKMRIGNLSYLCRQASILTFFFSALMLLCLFGTGTRAKQQGINAAIAEFEPALAVRAPACITCHAKILPSCITDFGYGNAYFFGKKTGEAKFGHFDGNVYGDFYGSEPNKTGWLTAEIGKLIIVPEASFDFDLAAAGSKLDPQNYRRPLQAKSLAGYLQALEKEKSAPATVLEKKTVFIGAPDAATLEDRFTGTPGSIAGFKYLKNDTTSPGLSGIELNSGKDFYTNTGAVVCDGDLFIPGTVFLNHVTISTNSGCRIYATGPIFLQDAVAYKSLDTAANNANLQLVSSEAILLGIGDKSCDATFKDSPLSRRLVSGIAVSTFMTRQAVRRSVPPQTIGKSIYDQGKLIPALEDAGCEDDSIGFSGLLLDAPLVHNRYKGNFRGLVIAEFALFRLSKASLEFDPVFRKVPILPRLKDSDYLEVK
jgi:hypothetical protein